LIYEFIIPNINLATFLTKLNTMILLCGGPDCGAYFMSVLTLLFFIAFIRALLSSSVVARAMNQSGLSVEGIEVASAEYYQAMKEQLLTHRIKGLTTTIKTLPEGE